MDKVKNSSKNLQLNIGDLAWSDGSAIEIEQEMKYEIVVYLFNTQFKKKGFLVRVWWIKRYRKLTQSFLLQIFSGNSNTYTVVENKLEPVIRATKIRLIPYSLHRRTGNKEIE